MDKKKILLFGKNGALGKCIMNSFANDYYLEAPSRDEVDLKNSKSILNYINNKEFDLVVYSAGISSVEYCEINKKEALTVNYYAPKIISKEISKRKIKFVYFSTDAVFRGDSIRAPYRENDKIDPVNYYGITKSKAENAVLSSFEENLVIRLITLYSPIASGRVDFAKRILNDLKLKDKSFGIIDQKINPTYAPMAAKCLSLCLNKKVSGILHLGAGDFLTNFDFSKKIATKFGFNKKKIIPIKLSEFFKNSKVQRGNYSWLDVSYAQKILGKNAILTNDQCIKEYYKELVKSQANL